MKKWRLIVWLGLLVCLLGTTNLMAADSTFNAWEEWRKGYDIFQRADKELQKGNLREALQLYRESRDLYIRVQKERPDWNQAIIKRRLELCEEQISKIAAKISESGGSSKKTPSKDNKEISRIQNDKNSNRNDLSNTEYRQKYFELLVVVENLRKQLREKNISNNNLESLIKEKQTLENNYKSLQKRYEELKTNSDGGVGSSEFDNVQKLLIAEKMKAENLEKKLKIVNEKLRKEESINRNNEKDLESLNTEKNRYAKSVESLQNELKKADEANSRKNDELKDLKTVISKNLSTIDNLNSEIAKNKEEITKLNRWIEDLQKKQNDAMHEKVFAENRKLKLVNNEIEQKYTDLNNKYNEIAAKVKSLQLHNQDYTNTIAVLERREKATIQELNNLREQYLLQQRSNKSLEETHNKLKEENKKNYDNLNLLIAKNEELNLKLNNKSNSEELSHKENQKIREELEKQKKQTALNIEALQQNIKGLEKANRELVAENNSLKTRKIDNSQKFVMNDNQEFEKLKADYKALKEKYEFLSMEIESLSQPVTEVQEKKVNSDEELKTFMKTAAEEALNAGDISSACWYFEELKKFDTSSVEFNTYYLLFKVASDKSSIEANMAEIKKLDNSAEKQLILNYIDITKGAKGNLTDNTAGKKILNSKFFELAKSKIMKK